MTSLYWIRAQTILLQEFGGGGLNKNTLSYQYHYNIKLLPMSFFLVYWEFEYVLLQKAKKATDIFEFDAKTMLYLELKVIMH